MTFEHITRRGLLTCLVVCLLWTGCKEKPDPEPDPLQVTEGVLMLNEGNFQSGNASLSYLDGNDSLYADVFKAVHDLPLGDVAQSMTLFGGDLWVVVNNSGKVYRLGLPGLDIKCVVDGLVSPRYFLPVSATKAYVSDLYANAVTIIDPSDCSKKGNIAAGGWTEEMMLLNGKVFVAQTGTDKLLVIDAVNDQLLDSTTLGRGPVSLCANPSGGLWVLCDGGLGADLASLHLLDTGADTLIRSYSFPDPASFPSDLRLSADGMSLFWLDQGVWKMDIASMSLPTTALIPANGRVFYALGIDPLTGNIWVSDAKDFVRSSDVLVYTQAGAQVRSFSAGVNTGEFLFLP